MHPPWKTPRPRMLPATNYLSILVSPLEKLPIRSYRSCPFVPLEKLPTIAHPPPSGKTTGTSYRPCSFFLWKSNQLPCILFFPFEKAIIFSSFATPFLCLLLYIQSNTVRTLACPPCTPLFASARSTQPVNVSFPYEYGRQCSLPSVFASASKPRACTLFLIARTSVLVFLRIFSHLSAN